MIYLDNHATTPVDPRVADRVYHMMVSEFGNASSSDHDWGDRAQAALHTAAQQVAALIGAAPHDILWTSGATESINLAIQGTVKHLERSGIFPRIALSAVEHKAVLDTCHALEKAGRIECLTLPVNGQAQIDLAQVEQACASGIHLLCIMAANNEVGTVYPVEKIGAIARQHHTPFLCDATQAVGKLPLQCHAWGITLLALSAHKLYGPKGVGALVVQRSYPLEPLFYGGGHQGGLRSGTLNVPGIVGLGEACRLRQHEMAADERAIGELRDRLQAHLQAEIPGLVVNGDPAHRLAGNLHISIPGLPNSAIVARVRHQLAIATGSACTSGTEAPSHVLRAMHLPDPLLDGALRLSLGKFTTAADIDQAATHLIQATRAIRAILEEA